MLAILCTLLARALASVIFGLSAFCQACRLGLSDVDLETCQLAPNQPERWTSPRKNNDRFFRSVTRSPWWLRWVLLFTCLRVGEASVPGPTWTLCVANLNGLSNRAFGLGDLYDTWLISETHLTAVGLKAFQANLRQAQSPYSSFVSGCPVAPRTVSSDVGQYSGVGVLSKFPVRRLPHDWTPAAYQSGRLVCTSVCAHGLWVSGVVVYGTPTGPTHVNGLEVTDQLLTQALERAEQLTGPRYIAGDFNHDWDRLKTVEMMHRLGYQDVQDLQAAATGEHPQATCRGKTRRDFLFVSRELASLFVQCQVDDESLSDHSYLVGTFHGGPQAFRRFVWPLPDPMEWEPAQSRAPVDAPLFHNPDQVTADYQSFWAEVESRNMDARRIVSKPYIRAMTGRATQNQPVERVGHHAPLKASRPGDRKPAFLGSCLQHAQWTKQYRRLQSYVRLVASSIPTAAHRAHQFQLWTAILGARGFSPTFALWWSERSHCSGEPDTVPIEPPSHAAAVLYLAALQSDLSALEKSLNASRSHARRLAKASDIHAMYQTVKRDPPIQVDSLATTTQVEVVDVDEEESAVVIARPIPWRPDVPILHQSRPVSVIHADDDKLWLESCAGIQSGDVLTQCKQGDLPELFQAFEAQWSALWNRHVNIPPGQWDQIIDFASATLRPVDAPAPSYTVGVVRRTLQSKSKHAATSLDGVSRADLMQLSDPDMALLCKVYQQAITTGSWPDQVLSGYVRSLAKVESPSEVGHFRPITVFSNVYRTWSSIAARHWLTHLSKVVDSFLCGNTTGCRAGMVWRFVLQQVEESHRGQGNACGFSADIVKAFNILPRVPALAAAKLLGVDHGTLTAWAGALGGFKRHFVVRGSFSPGVLSANGFPEGCALSCVAMLALTELFHKWLYSANMMFRPVSYVDNWGVLVRSVEAMQQACTAVDQFAKALCLDLDAKKSYCWATDKVSRRQLRDAGFTILLHTRELGAHVVYSRQLANGTSLTRFKQLEDFWHKLASCRCVYQQKIRLIQRVAWPRVMHAVSAVVIGKKHFDSLRTDLMQALHLQKPGASPLLQCALEGTSFDPMVFAAFETLRDARALASRAQVEVDFNVGLFDEERREYNSLTEILGQRLHQLGFRLAPNAHAEDAIGSFNVLTCPMQEFVLRAQWTWTSVVACKVSHRRSFRGFENVDLLHTRQAYQALQPYDQGIIRKHLHGASFTNAHAKHWSTDGTDLCLLCGSQDSVYHRLWECSGSEKLRADLPDDVVVASHSSPAVLIEHGWTLSAPLSVPWFRYLSTLAVPDIRPLPSHSGTILDLFTDGSCFFPRYPALRMAAFAVVVSRPFQLDFTPDWFQPLVAQPLPGILQTAYRAELMAAIVAIQYAIRAQSCLRVWTDCQNVVRAFQKYVLDARPVKPNGRNADLLLWFQEVAFQLGVSRLAVLKVPAHENKLDYPNDLERWLVEGNTAVGRAADVANRAREPSTWNLWTAYSDQVHQQHNLANAVRGHMIAVSKLWNAAVPSLARPCEPQMPQPMRQPRVLPDLVWTGPDPLDLQHPTFVRQFGQPLASAVQAWIQQVRDGSQPIRWISFFQLFVSFQLRWGPWYVGKPNGVWHVETGPAALLMNHVKLSVRIKYFRLMLQQFLKDCRVTFTTGTVRPESQWLKCFRGAMGFQFVPDEFDFVERWLSSKLSEPVTGAGLAIDSIRGI